MQKTGGALILLVFIVAPGCAKDNGDLTLGQNLGQSGVRFYEAIGQAGKLTQALEKAEIVPTEDALAIQEAFLLVNTSQQPFTDGLRKLADVEDLPEGSRVRMLEQVVELVGMVSAQVETVLEKLKNISQAEQIRTFLRTARDALNDIRLGLRPLLEEGVAS